MNRVDPAEEAFGIWTSARMVLRIFLARWWFFIPVALGVSLVLNLAEALVDPFGTDGAAPSAEPDDPFRSIWTPVLYIAGVLVVAVCEAAFHVMAAYDTKAGRNLEVADYLRAVRENLLPLLWAAVAVSILMTIGFVLLIVPAIWLSCLYAVVIPAVIVDRAGFGALGRSRFLTKGYRWPILGLGAAVGLAILAVQIPLFLLGIAMGPEGAASPVVSIAAAVTTPIVWITAAVGHRRLVELKAAFPPLPAG